MVDYRKMVQCAIILLLLATGNIAFCQTLKPGPQVLTFFSDVDDTEQPYGLYLPKNFKPTKKYPLAIMLHGAGSNHRLALRRVFGKSNLPDETDVEATRYFPEWRDVNYIVASPYARGTMGYQGIAEKDVYDVLADVKKRFPIDEDRVYLTGLSMGGGKIRSCSKCEADRCGRSHQRSHCQPAYLCVWHRRQSLARSIAGQT